VLLASTLGRADRLWFSPAGPVKTLAQARDGRARATAAPKDRKSDHPYSEGVLLPAGNPGAHAGRSNTTWEAAPGARSAHQRRAPWITGWEKSAKGRAGRPSTGPEFRPTCLSAGGGRHSARATPNFGFYRIDGPSPPG